MRGLILVVLAAAISAPAFAQVAPGGTVKVAQVSDARCRKDVKDYVDTLRLLRDTAGAQTGQLVAGAFFSEAEVERMVQGRGHCAAAQQLRDKMATR